MTTKILLFDDVKIKKYKFHQNKCPILKKTIEIVIK